MHGLRRLRGILAWAIGLPAVAWACAAIWFDGPATAWVAGLLVVAIGGAGLAALLRLRGTRRALALLAVAGCVAAWWLRLPARNDRDWQPDVARPAWASIDGDRVTIHNLRDFQYRSETDFTERWETRTFDLSQLLGVDLFISFWGPTAIAHTIVSWEFADGPPLAVSIETRKEVGESYSAVRGFFRQYELYYVVADERDVIGVRTNHRGEHVYLYRIAMTPEHARSLLLDYLAEINRINEQPRWYNAITQSCTSTIRHHMQHVGLAQAWSWQLLANGYLDQLIYARGGVETALPFEEFKARSEVTTAARAAGDAPDFSARIRANLPTGAR